MLYRRLVSFRRRKSLRINDNAEIDTTIAIRSLSLTETTAEGGLGPEDTLLAGETIGVMMAMRTRMPTATTPPAATGDIKVTEMISRREAETLQGWQVP